LRDELQPAPTCADSPQVDKTSAVLARTRADMRFVERALEQLGGTA
jgi:hypothetical protein